ncbi:MAG TPA: hypothetical protein VH012_00065 [Acidimicrobiales bacterium]|jgi:hypothetical protein|nr:hypothetical protein [Acidimicrobiales bacterium]
MRQRTTVVGLLGGTALAALLLAACSSNGSSPATSSTVTSATSTTTSSSSASTVACTKSLISAAAMSSSSVGSVSAVNGFGCSGSWAYADVSVGSGEESFDAVIVLQAQGSSWAVADRGNACNNHLVPSAIYTRACTTS